MYTNKDITVFTFVNGKCKRTEIKKVFWTESIDRVTTDKGIKHHTTATVYVPLSSMPDKFSLNVGDIVIKGIVREVPESNDEKAFSEWHKYVKTYFNTFTVTAVSLHDYGSTDMQHVRVVMV